MDHLAQLALVVKELAIKASAELEPVPVALAGLNLLQVLHLLATPVQKDIIQVAVVV